ncbi:MAG: hypothetical protein REI93_03770 [Pedobacter sp.]|nr:hypothetical protein [Pedobacter sp.]
MFTIAFTDLAKAKDFRDTLTFDKAKLGRFIAAMHDLKVRIIGRGLWYISSVHTQEDIDFAIAAAEKVLAEMATAQ